MTKSRLLAAQGCRMEDLPDACLHLIFRLLSARDLAALAVQAQYLRLVAEEPCLWGPHCLARWPGADVHLYRGSWCKLYQARARMPAAFPLAADKIRALTAGAQEGSHQQQPRGSQQQQDGLAQMAFDEVMLNLFAMGVAVSRDAALKRSPEFWSLKKDVAWWLSERPQVVVGFVRSANELLHGRYNMWTTANSSWGNTTWRRSAIAFLQELNLLTRAHQSVVERLQRETEALDRAMRGTVETDEEGTGRLVPTGVPSQRW